jgi:diguanylate cyclase (GGDEF)-like protein
MEKQKRLLVLTNDDKLRKWFGEFCPRHDDIETFFCSNAQDIQSSIAQIHPETVLLDTLLFPGSSAMILQEIRETSPILPIVCLVKARDRSTKLQFISGGGHSILKNPITDDDEAYYLVCNAVAAYREKSSAVREIAEMKARCESDRLNLLELELVKGLQHMIGETAEPAAILKHGFALIKNYLVFDVFAALVARRQEEEIYVYPNTAIRGDLAESIPGTLIKRMTRLAEDADTKVRVVIHGKTTGDNPSSDDLRSVIIPLVTSSKTYGYAGMYRSNPFDYQEESVFKRFCSHIATALEKTTLFEEIRALSTNDGLTGLYNHLSIVSRLEQEVQRSDRYGSPLSVLMLDIDDFKEVNDTRGHLAGDAVLMQLATLLQSRIRGIDSVGRYGGEEFLVILPETDGISAALLSDRLREAVGEHLFSYDGKSIRVSLSGGVAIHRDSQSPSELIGIADENLYRAKKEGKNRVYYDKNR